MLMMVMIFAINPSLVLREVGLGPMRSQWISCQVKIGSTTSITPCRRSTQLSRYARWATILSAEVGIANDFPLITTCRQVIHPKIRHTKLCE